ncbi:hypothetical protein SpCBS45565_g05480 [Spizellomyces sp. 'palustris']|nr:hypothetical protein SpCBS45565_g05480 [Spizellomyces sp. 'palustris']
MSEQHIQTSTPIMPKWDPSRTMKANVFHGTCDVRVETVPRPMITHPKDALIRVTATTICGSDLHLYHNEVPEMMKGDILGHEFMGIIEDVGDEVRDRKKGERVVVCFDIACGTCDYCKRGEFTGCDTTNDSATMEKLYGYRLSGIFGYSHLTGGYPGGQAEYVRVPFADVNTLPVPDSLPDEKVLFLSDIACTSWYANECAQVGKGDKVAIWGGGPIGQFSARWAMIRGASDVVVVETVEARRKMAESYPGVKSLNPDDIDVVETLKRMLPGGPDACIDATGFRYSKTWVHKVERSIKAETDAVDILEEIIKSCRKYGRIGLIADYIGYANHFPIAILIRGGQCPCQRYWKDILGRIEKGQIDPSFIITHRPAFDDIPKAYATFDKKEDGMIKNFIRPPSAATST